METATWIEGWADFPRGRGEKGLTAVTGDARYPIPPAELMDGSLKAGMRISFTLRKRKWKGRVWVEKLLIRP